MKTLLTRRELLAAIGIATLIDCRQSDRHEPERSDSTVTLTVDGMI